MDERHLFDFFSVAGTVSDIRIIKDPRTRKSKGLAYIELKNLADIPNALALSGQPIQGLPISIAPSEAEKSFRGSSAPIKTATSLRTPFSVAVSNVHANIGEDDLKTLFEPFGKVVLVEMTAASGPTETASAIIYYTREQDMRLSAEKLNGINVLGQNLNLKAAEPVAAPVATDRVNVPQSAAERARAAAASVAAAASSNGVGYNQAPTNDDNNLGLERLDENEQRGGYAMTASSKLELMRKLQRGEDMGFTPAAVVSFCLSISHVFFFLFFFGFRPVACLCLFVCLPYQPRDVPMS